MRIAIISLVFHLMAAAGTMAGTITVTDPAGKPVKDAEVFLVHPEKKVYTTGKTDENGKVELKSEYKGSVVVFCAHKDFCAFRKRGYNPDKALEVTLRKQENTGSIVCADGTGYVPGLIGRLNPILDTSDRRYMYADNISLNDGTQQPVHFQLGRALKAEDRDGSRFALTVIDIIGRTSLIEFKKRK